MSNKIIPIHNETHDELIKLLIPLIDFLDKNNYSYILIAGKDGVCSRFMNGKFIDLGIMLTTLAEQNPEVKDLIKTTNSVLEDINTTN